ncbi:FMN-binding protein [Agromyces arachidis]|uniref:FMN-binding protein n=1 Tax=Agromyces arachidis TaxID=766966 RepID=UPI004055BDB4
MRARAVVLASAASAAAILGGWQLGAIGSTAPAVNDATSAGAAGSGGSASGDSSSGAASASASTGDAGGTFTGPSVSTRFGDVQVSVTVAGGTIQDVTALRLTDHDGRSVQISNRAAPILRSEVLQAQSASVSMVGGATYTSRAYLESLQAALDQAGY